MVTECVSVRAASTSKLAGTRKPVPATAAAEVTARIVTMMAAVVTAGIVTVVPAEMAARIVTSAMATEVAAAVATAVTAAVTAAMAATTTAAAALTPRSVSYWRQRQRNTHRQSRNEPWLLSLSVPTRDQVPTGISRLRASIASW